MSTTQERWSIDPQWERLYATPQGSVVIAAPIEMLFITNGDDKVVVALLADAQTCKALGRNMVERARSGHSDTLPGKHWGTSLYDSAFGRGGLQVSSPIDAQALTELGNKLMGVTT